MMNKQSNYSKLSHESRTLAIDTAKLDAARGLKGGYGFSSHGCSYKETTQGLPCPTCIENMATCILVNGDDWARNAMTEVLEYLTEGD